MEEDFEEQPSLSRRLLRFAGIGAVVLLVLAVILYFVASSSAFVKGVILPRVGKSMNAEIKASDVSLSPFSQARLTKIQVQGAGAQPVFTADELIVRYRLLSILRGTYVVDELTLVSPTLQIITEPSGVSNLDPITSSQNKTTGAPSKEPLRVALKNLTIKDGAARFIDKAKDGSVATTEVTQLNVSLDRLENGQSGKLTLASVLHLAKQSAAGTKGTNSLLEGKIDGNFEFKFDPDLLPQSLTGSTRMAFGRAEGAYGELNGLAASLQIETTPSDVRQLGLRFERAGQALGRIQMSGPLNLAKAEGRLRLEILAIDRQVLNLFGVGSGWDFGRSTVNSTNYIDLAKQGDLISVRGQLSGRQLELKQGTKSSPPSDLDVTYDVAIDRHDQNAVVSRLALAGRQGNKEFLRAGLDRPMTLTWASTVRGFAESTFHVNLSQVNLDDWQSITGINEAKGKLDLDLSVVSRKDGQELSAKGDSAIQNFSGQFGTNAFQNGAVSMAFDARMDKFKLINVDSFRVEVLQRAQPFFKATGSAHYDVEPGDLILQTAGELALASFFRQFPQPGVAASNGTLRISSSFTRKNQKPSLTGNLSLADFTGKYTEYSFQNLELGLDYNVNVDGKVVEIQSAALTVRRGYTGAGMISLAGTYQQNDQAARFDFKVVDLNENALTPFLASSLGEKKLVSISLNGNGSASYDPRGEATLKAGLNIDKWVVADPKRGFVPPPLSVATQVEGSMRKQIIDLPRLLVKLSPTKLATNELLVKAHLDLGKTNPSPSQCSLQSESLDLTPYYNIFADNRATNAPAGSPAPAPAAAPAPKAEEPAATHFPVQQLTADARIGRLYLRDVAITNLQLAAKVVNDQVTLLPLQMLVNGGAVTGSASLNLATPGYGYDLTIQADKVPLEPLANTFTTNAPGTYKGDTFAKLQLKGSGTTDASLRKNLTGSLSLDLTNMNYEIVGQKTKRLLEPIAAVLNLPELMQTPLNWIGARADIGTGQVNVRQFTVRSQAFLAESQGAIPMAEVITNSPLKLPVELSLLRSLADRAHLTPANAPTNTPYVQLPTFVTLAGTIGNAKTEVNKLVVGGLAMRSLSNIPQLGGKAGTVLQGLGNVLTQQPAAPAATNSPARTNAPANTASTVLQGLDSLLGRQKSGSTTNTNAPPSTNKTASPALLDLLNKVAPEKKK